MNRAEITPTETTKSNKAPSLVGQRFTRWTVLKHVGYNNNATRYLCRCDCGTERIVNRNYLLDGRSRSCGCMVKVMGKTRVWRTHGLSQTKEYDRWQSMRHTEGVAGRWRDVRKYVADSRRNPGKWALRIDRTRPYSPKNCRWVSRAKYLMHTFGIEDQFTELPVSRQLRYQRRKKAQGLCTICGQRKAYAHSLCEPCAKRRGTRHVGRNRRRQ